MRTVFVLDKAEAEWNPKTSSLKPGRLQRLLDYTAKFLKIESWEAVVAGPSGKPATAKQYREEADRVWTELVFAAPDRVVLCGRGSLYAFEQYAPKVKSFERLWGEVFQAEEFEVVVAPSPALLFVTKVQKGGYTYLRSFIESAGARPTLEPALTGYEFMPDAFWIEQRLEYSLMNEKPGIVGLDTETTGLNPRTNAIRTVQMSFADGRGYTFVWDALQPERWQHWIDLIAARGHVFALQNGKFDYKFLAANGVFLPDWLELSTMHVILDEREGTHNLDFIAKQTLNERKLEIPLEELLTADLERIAPYAARDTDLTRRAALVLEPTVRERSAHSILARASATLAHAEHIGLRVDAERLHGLSSRVEDALAARAASFEALGFNPQAPKEVAAHFGLIGTTNKTALEELDDPVARAVIEYRGLNKIKSTYLDRIAAAARFDGRFHPDFRLAGPITGRTSSGSGSSKPGFEWLPINIQNIPRTAQEGQELTTEAERLRASLRSLFVADPGHVLVGMDLAAAEMRMAANLCLDPQMVLDMNNRVDTHSLLAIQAFGLPVEIDLNNPKAFSNEVKAKYAFQRQSAKALTFGTIYKGGPAKLAQVAGITEEEGRALQDTIFKRYPGLRSYMNRIDREVETKGRIVTPWGRQRIFPYSTGIFDNRQKAEMKREAFNYLVQSMASDYALLAMGLFDLEYRARGWQTLLFVHDAIYVQCPEEDGEACERALVEITETAARMPATMYAEAHHGRDWGSL